jgi:hypothetical protein
MIENSPEVMESMPLAPQDLKNCFNQPFINWNGIIDYSSCYHQNKKAEFGRLSDLVTDELIGLCQNKKYIVIYGHSKSGKAIIGKLISQALRLRLIISDDYQYLGWKNNMYHIREIIKSSDEPLIIEGIHSGRLLRKGVQLNDFFADLVIHLEINKESLSIAYQKDGEGDKLLNDKIFNFNKKNIDKIFFEWHEMQKKLFPEKMPIIININTSFSGF